MVRTRCVHHQPLVGEVADALPVPRATVRSGGSGVAIFFSSETISFCSSFFRSSIAASWTRKPLFPCRLERGFVGDQLLAAGAFLEFLGKLDLLLPVGFGDQPGALGDDGCSRSATSTS